MISSYSDPLPTPLSSQDKWIVGEKIFQGRAGSLHRVMNPEKPNRNLVVKVSSSTCAKNEIYFLSHLDHPHIIGFSGSYEKDGRQYLILERARGADLCTQILRFGACSTATARWIFRQSVDAVCYLHSLNIAHRDIKLDNFLVMNEVKSFSSLSKSLIKLTDFEFAIDCPRGEKLAKLRGTKEYSAPEVLAGKYCPFSADCWSLGVCLYILLKGEFPPFEDASLEEIQYHINSAFTKKGKLIRDLLLRIFTSEEKRLTIEEIANHAWLQEDSEGLDRKSPLKRLIAKITQEKRSQRHSGGEQ